MVCSLEVLVIQLGTTIRETEVAICWLWRYPELEKVAITILLYPEFVGFHLFIYFPNTVVFFLAMLFFKSQQWFSQSLKHQQYFEEVTNLCYFCSSISLLLLKGKSVSLLFPAGFCRQVSKGLNSRLGSFFSYLRF